MWCATCDTRVKVTWDCSSLMMTSDLVIDDVQVYPEEEMTQLSAAKLKSASLNSMSCIMEENSWSGNADIKNIVININCDSSTLAR